MSRCFPSTLWDAPKVIKALAGGAIAVHPATLGALTVSTLEGERGYQRKEIEKLLAFLADEPQPDVVNIPYTLLIALAAPIKRILGCPVVVTLQGEDLFLEGLPERYRLRALELIKAQTADVDLFIAVSHYYADFMKSYLSIPPEKMRVAPLGITLEDIPEAAPLKRNPFTIGFLARIAPEKGLHVLADAYILLRKERDLPPSRLYAAGYLPPEHRRYLQRIERTLEAAGLENEFVYAGALDRRAKFAFLQGLDAFSVPSPYHEPKGLYLLEAMAAGVPVVQPLHGAFPEIIGRTGGGLLAASNAPGAIADKLMQLWQHPDRATDMGRRGREGVNAHYSIGHMADAVLRIYAEADAEWRRTGSTSTIYTPAHSN
ncbi:MAG: glycosyltransferase family 4 protein [Acidobacteria bacterium]|nr:glycosyltransferase family 4 protein [Acidobacteriota bacterium]